jgi:hypothetical protein
MQTATRTLHRQKGIAEEAVLKYLKKNRRLFLNTSCYLSDAVVLDCHAKQILLVQCSFVGLNDLMLTLREWNHRWPQISYAVHSQFSLEWEIVPWLFIYEPHDELLRDKVTEMKPNFGYRVTHLEDI